MSDLQQAITDLITHCRNEGYNSATQPLMAIAERIAELEQGKLDQTECAVRRGKKIAELERDKTYWESQANNASVKAGLMEERAKKAERERDEAKDRCSVLMDQHVEIADFKRECAEACELLTRLTSEDWPWHRTDQDNALKWLRRNAPSK